MPLEAGEFRAVYLELRLAADGLDKELREGVKAAVDGAAEAVRQAASWSTRIPAATRARVSFAGNSASASVVVSAREAPEARPLEHGGRTGTFRHPVFGNRDNWVEQAARPFFNAASENAEAVRKAAEDVLDHVTFLAGFK